MRPTITRNDLRTFRRETDRLVRRFARTSLAYRRKQDEKLKPKRFERDSARHEQHRHALEDMMVLKSVTDFKAGARVPRWSMTDEEFQALAAYNRWRE